MKKPELIDAFASKTGATKKDVAAVLDTTLNNVYL